MDDSQIEQESLDLAYLSRRAQALIAEEFSSEFLRKVPPLVIGVALVTVAASFLSPPGEHLAFGLLWLLVAVFELICLRQFWRQSRARFSERYALLAALGIIAWWAALARLGIQSAYTIELLLWVITLVLASLAWSLSSSLTIFSTLTIATLSSLGLFRFPSLTSAFVLITVFLGTWGAMKVRLAVNFRLACVMLSRYCENPPYTRNLVRLFAWLANEMLATRHCLLLYERSLNVESAAAFAVRELSLDPPLQKMLFGIVESEDAFVGGYKLSLDRQVLQALREQGVQLSNTGFYCLLSGVVAGQEQRILFLFSRALSGRLLNSKRASLALRSLATLTRVALNASRARVLSSSALLESQQGVSEKEKQLSSLVHQVNNFSQSVLALCDDGRRLLHAQAAREGSSTLLELLERIERRSRFLALEVSDARREVELTRISALAKAGLVGIGAVLADLRTFLLHRCEARGLALAFDMDEHLLAGMATRISEDVCGTILRSFTRWCIEAALPGSNVRCAVQVAQQVLTLNVVIGVRPEAHEFIEAMAGIAAGLVEPAPEAPRALRLLRLLAAPGKKAIATRLDLGRGLVEIELQVPVESHVPIRSARRDGYFLFVDDSADVRSFYQRVAQALGRPAVVTGTYAEALEAVAKDGPPQVVVTDLELGDSSQKGGLDLVRWIEEHCSPKPPILVVSGKVGLDQSIVGKGVHVLSKPVSKKAFFDRLQQLMGER
jgi:CheY-like chemotaxis protein